MITMMYLTPATGVPPLVLADGTDEATQLAELETVGRTLARRVADVLVQFDRPRTSKGPTEAINGGLERPWVCNVINYIARALLDTGRIRPRIHSSTAESDSKVPRICGGRRVHGQ
jgi:hypothetical protein